MKKTTADKIHSYLGSEEASGVHLSKLFLEYDEQFFKSVDCVQETLKCLREKQNRNYSSPIIFFFLLTLSQWAGLEVELIVVKPNNLQESKLLAWL